MDQVTIIGLVSIIMSGLTIAIGGFGTALAEGNGLAEAMRSIAQQPDASDTITRTLFVGIALVESIAIYCLVISLLLIFFNPFWNFVTQGG